MKIHVIYICWERLQHLVEMLVEFLKLVLKEPLLHSMSVVEKISFCLHGLNSTGMESVVLYTSKDKGGRKGTHALWVQFNLHLLCLRIYTPYITPNDDEGVLWERLYRFLLLVTISTSDERLPCTYTTNLCSKVPKQNVFTELICKLKMQRE